MSVFLRFFCLYVEWKGDNETSTALMEGSGDSGGTPDCGGTPDVLGGRVLIAKVRLVRRGRGPGCFIVQVALTSNFGAVKISNRTRQNFLKFCQLVRNGESGRFTLMTRND